MAVRDFHRACKKEMIELCEGRLIGRVAAFQEVDELSQAVNKILSEALGVAKTDVEIVRGS